MPTATNTQKIAGLYSAFFNRAPDNNGLATWEARIITEQSTLSDIAAGFAAHPLFTTTYGDMPDQQFVEAIYTNVLGSAGDSGGISYWLNYLTDPVTPHTRADMVAQFVSDSLEYDADAAWAAGAIDQATYDAALTRQAFITNKADVGIYFAQTLGEYSNVTDNNNPEQDPAYLASIEILSNVTDSADSVTAAKATIDDAVASADPVGAILGETVVPGETFVLTASATNLVAEGQDISFTVTPSVASDTETTLYVQISGAAVGAITAQASADDFSSVLLPVTIPAGSTEPVVVFATVAADAVTEGPEGFQAKLLDSSFNVVADAAAVTGTITEGVSTGQTFTLTTGADAPVGTTGNDTFVATETTLSSADVLDGGDGTDTLRYASSGAALVNEAGFEASNIETVQVTSDATGGTVFDVTGVTELETLRNFNSSEDLTLVGMDRLADVELQSIGSAGALANDRTPDTTLVFNSAVVAGNADALNVSLNGNLNVDGTPIGDLTAQGIETFNLTTAGGASQIGTLISGTLETVNIEGDQNLTITTNLVGATTVDANAFTGDLSVVADSGINDVVVTGGTGDDEADFSNGWDTDDSFDGGDGTDTIGLTNARAVASTTTTGGTLTNVEQLNVTTLGTGTIDMDAFPDVTKVIYDAGLTNAVTSTIDDAVSGITVEVDTLAGGTGNLTVDLKTDDTADEVSIEFDGIAVGHSVGTLTADDAETLNISADDDTVIGNGDLTIANLALGDTATLNLSGDADLTLTTATNPATPVLTTLNAATATGNVSISGLNTAAAGATVTLGSGDDLFNVATSNGADTITLGAGADTIVYTAVAQSDRDMDTVADFASGTDSLDLSYNAAGAATNWGGAAVAGVDTFESSTQFVGNYATFAQAQGALNGAAVSAVFQQDEQILWLDADKNGTLDNNDFRVKLDGVTSLTAADLGFVVGNTLDLTAPAAVVSRTVATNATAMTTNQDDTINTTVANLAGSTINGALGDDTLNVSGSAAGITSLTGVAAADPALTSVENVNFTSNSGTLALAAAIGADVQRISVNGGNFTATTTANGQNFSLTGSGVATLTFGAFTGSLSSDAGADTINGVTLAGQTVSTGAGTDTISVTANAGMGATIDGGGDADTLNWVASATGAQTMATIQNVETVDVTTNSGNTLTINDDVDTVRMLAAGDGSGLTVNATAAQANNLTVTDLDGGADTLSVTTAGTLTLGTLTAVETVTFAAGDNDVTTTAANVAAATSGFTGGVGTNTLTLTTALTAPTDLDTVTNFDVINLGGGANTLTPIVDTIVAAGESLLIDAIATTGASTINVTAETDGVVNITAGAGGSTITMAANNLADTITLGAGADAVVLDASSTVGNLSQLDQIVDFKQAGADTIDFTTNGVAPSGTVYTLNIASATLSGLAGAANTAIANNGIGAAIGDIFLIEVAGGTGAGTYAVQDLTADNITSDDLIVQLTGNVGAIAPADFV